MDKPGQLTKVFNLQNVKCAGCVNKIQSNLKKLDSVLDAKVNLLDKTLTVYYQSPSLDMQVIMKIIKQLGYGISEDKVTEDSVNLGLMVILPMLIATFLMWFTMNNTALLDLSTTSGLLIGLSFAMVSIVVVLFSGYKCLASGFIGLIKYNLNMYSLVVIAVSVALIYSLWVIIATYYGLSMYGQHIYFDAALMIIGIINLGSYLEAKAKNNATEAIRGLSQLIPDTTLLVQDGCEQIIATNLLRTDYLVRIKSGDKIPADGELVEGSGLVNESMLSGESRHISKKIGDSVVGGSINVNGSFVFKVTAIGDNTFLAYIIQLIKNASLSKPKLVELADNIVKVFVPLVTFIALVSATIWYVVSSENQLYTAINVFMSVLLIACPCSIGLAIPVSLVVGVGVAAKKGILIRDSSCLSDIDKLDVVLLDKTGTITEGSFDVVNFVMYDDLILAKEDVLRNVAIIESHSNHPLAQIIKNYCYSNGVINNDVVTKLSVIDGLGIQAEIANHMWYIGSYNYMQQLNLNFSAKCVKNLFIQVYIARDNQLLARFEIADKIKLGSKYAVDKLKQLGLSIKMVTGDNELVAGDIAKQVGIDDVIANCLPQDKLAVVSKLQQEGHKVVFVGDGVNDAPSLQQANIGISIGDSLDIAKHSAAINLVNSDLIGVYKALVIAKKIQLNMYQNLYGSFMYNFSAILIASGLFYPWWGIMLNPMIASLVMSLSSLSVIINALRLRF